MSFLQTKKPMLLCQLRLQMMAGDLPLRGCLLLYLWRSAVETGARLDQRERAGSTRLPISVKKKTSMIPQHYNVTQNKYSSLCYGVKAIIKYRNRWSHLPTK